MEPEDITTAKEGRTCLLVPRGSLLGPEPPRRPAFYNPQARFSRDISMVVYRAIAQTFLPSQARFGDSLASLGARGIRVAVEVPEVGEVHMNDLNGGALELAKRAAELNGVKEKCFFTNSEACHFLIDHSTPGERFEIVDVDPFGSPSPYVDCALRAVRDEGLLSLTATDTATLCGIYPRVALRRYYGYSARTEYCHEIAVRLLFGALAKEAARLDLGMVPIFSHSTRHYVRVYGRILSGSSSADQTLDRIGLLGHCFRCGWRSRIDGASVKCEDCSRDVTIIGPLWVYGIYDRSLLKRGIELSADEATACRNLFSRALEEVDMPPSYYSPSKIADFLQVSTPSSNAIISRLGALGHRATRTALDPRGVKTDAPITIISKVIRELSASA